MARPMDFDDLPMKLVVVRSYISLPKSISSKLISEVFKWIELQLLKPEEDGHAV